ncbi:MAG: GGDEF domain-containing protein [Burkholderiales bacterium]|jgi:diguanylate cyclase (GGDEF)-like protein|uniref:GGDEF domain-containing protein n=1 Tax=Limnobacter sp. TaxID=2003368 RepID=UPI0039BD88AB|nr:GGDEF domain-containing protein [Burkholderiales bacterium]
MDSVDNGPATTKGQTWLIHTIDQLRLCSEKTVRYFWLVLCVILTAVAVVNYGKAEQIQADLTKRRLLEVSLQDLIIQSTALQHLDKEHAYETKLGLEARGYSSPQELFNQLAARLAVIETINTEIELTESAANLREHLVSMDQQLGKFGKPNPRNIELWFIELGIFNNTLKKAAEVADEKFKELQRNNLILTLIVLVHSISFVSLTLWRQSALRKRFANELTHLSNQARCDALTGLLNRRGWQDMSGAYLRKMQKENQLQGSMAIIDIDYFKQYNDTYGHEAGDNRLREFAETLRSNFRPGDLIARIGGEEFAVLLPNCTADDAQRIVDRIRHKGTCKVGFSAGICDIAHSDSIDRTMARADQALYQAKNKGRNCSCLGKVSS